MPFSNLNFEQQEAVHAPHGHNLVIASAGTGKTSTIVARLAKLLQNEVPPEQILLLTFTNKAAAEMVQRVQRYFPKDVVKKINAGTFHSISYKTLKQLRPNLVLKQPKDLKILLRSIEQKRSYHHLPRTIKPFGATHLYELNSLYQNENTDKGFDEWITNRQEDHKVFSEIYADILDEFKEQKEKFGYVDFNDLLILMKEHLTSNDVVFNEVLVDEYQDTNSLQGSLIDSFKTKSLFCVGDYDQSIYAFNGANIDIIANFSTRYDNSRVFTLKKNYRSSKSILDLANSVIKKNPRLYKKELIVTKTSEDISPKLVMFDELFDEYANIAKDISLSTTKKDEIAVIFRNNSSADGMEASLKEQGIACKRKGGISFFDSKEIKAILDIFSIISNGKDLMAFIHIFEYAKGVGANIAKELFDALLVIGGGSVINGFLKPDSSISNPFPKKVKNFQLGLFDDMESIGSVSRFASLDIEDKFLSNAILKHSKINSSSALFLYEFYKLLHSCIHIKNPASLIQKIASSKVFEEIVSILAKQRATLKDGTIDENLHSEVKDRIARKAIVLENLSSKYNNFFTFLNAITLGSGEMSEGEGVNLLSVHASKGLEFEEVYIIDLMDGRFPNNKLANNAGGIEEERRLFYVAVTRAKSKLILSLAKYDKIKKIDYVPSIFLYEANMLKDK